ncbi:MAG: NUDIX hydrolase [Desulfotalea sp.]
MPCKKQFGVIPYIETDDKIKVILITSRTNSFWIFPKGNLMRKKDEFASAEQEAWEEAGVKGKIDKKHPYLFSYQLNDQQHKLTLYPMKVESILDEWPEKCDRKRKTVSIKKALELVEIEAFTNCLLAFKKDFC